MSYNIYQINDLTNLSVTDILREGIKADMFRNEEVSKNYLYAYKDQPSNLFFLLDNGRYYKGNYFVVTDKQDNLLAAAGWNHYTNHIALVLTRMIVIPKIRSQYVVGQEILPIILEETKAYKKKWITANDYNKSIYHYFERISQGKSSSISNQWPEIYKKFKPIGQREVNHTLQWVAELENK